MKKSITFNALWIVFIVINILFIGACIGFNVGCNSVIVCGSCGAHVHDWWYVDNIHTGEPIEVCEFCYQSAIS